ncbi:MAG: FtsW/RodA/SpoVE family cell cycle protein [Erysipelotrichaceae bacterium]|nr:FtsW/RodA/SpoVE family cell cycle protein [Erysipelotrichaceae bacterium]
MKRTSLFRLIRLPKEADHLLHYTVIILGIFGVVMQVSASMSSSTVSLRPLLLISFKQIAFFVISYLAMMFFANVFSFEFVRKYIDKVVIITGLLLIIALAFPTVGGSNAWIKVGMFGVEVSLQPSEFTKLTMIVLMAIYLGDVKRQELPLKKLVIKPLVIFLAYIFIIAVLQRDVGSALILVLITLVTFLVPSNKSLRRMQLLCVLLAALFVFMMMWFMTDSGIAFLEKISIFKYQLVRFKAAINPFTERYEAGYYDLVNSLIGFNTGGWTGVGLGKSLRKYGYLSAASTDFIMAVIVEELGIGGFFLVFIGYAVIIAILVKYALKAFDEKSKIVIIGVAMYFFFHFVFNIGGVTCLIPLTGIPLLLISSGGSSSMACLSAIGIVQALIAHTRKLQKEKELVNENNRG